MVDLSASLPRTEASDPAEVALALETARTLWSRGQSAESVRWIQRAAETAESAGDDLRAVSLARAAADLRAEVQLVSEPPPAIKEAPVLAPYDDFTEQTLVDSPSSSMARSVLLISQASDSSPPKTELAPQAPAVEASARVPEHAAVRVAVLSSDAATRQLSLRILIEGEPAPEGTLEALLVPLDPRAKLSP
jgi:hypothetical protein